MLGLTRYHSILLHEVRRSFGWLSAEASEDCGTENVTVAALQSLLAQDRNSHMYGSSPSNQRIESWWSFYRRSRSAWWSNFFQSFVHDGVFHVGDAKETDCMRFCFMELMRNDLREVVHEWNTHRIRPSRGSRCPAGVPDELYFMPSAPAAECLISNVPPLCPEVRAQLKEPTVCSDPVCVNTWFTCVRIMVGSQHQQCRMLQCCIDGFKLCCDEPMTLVVSNETRSFVTNVYVWIRE